MMAIFTYTSFLTEEIYCLWVIYEILFREVGSPAYFQCYFIPVLVIAQHCEKTISVRSAGVQGVRENTSRLVFTEAIRMSLDVLETTMSCRDRSLSKHPNILIRFRGDKIPAPNVQYDVLKKVKKFRTVNPALYGNSPYQKRIWERKRSQPHFQNPPYEIKEYKRWFGMWKQIKFCLTVFSPARSQSQ